MMPKCSSPNAALAVVFFLQTNSINQVIFQKIWSPGSLVIGKREYLLAFYYMIWEGIKNNNKDKKNIVDVNVINN